MLNNFVNASNVRREKEPLARLFSLYSQRTAIAARCSMKSRAGTNKSKICTENKKTAACALSFLYCASNGQRWATPSRPCFANLCRNKSRNNKKMCRNLEFVPVSDLVPVPMPPFTKNKTRPEIVPKIIPETPQNPLKRNTSPTTHFNVLVAW